MYRIACHTCDLVQTLPPMPDRATARCTRCDSLLFQRKVDSIDRTIAWAIAGMVLFLVAISFPFLGMQSAGLERHTALLTGVREIYSQGMVGLATLVLLTCVVVPLIQMAGLLYVVIPLKFGWVAPFASSIFRLYQHVQPWSMMEVFMLGILVALVKLGKMATIVPGLAVFAFGLLIYALISAVSAVDAHHVWARMEALRDG